MTIKHLKTELSGKVRNANRHGTLVNAIVTDVFYDKVAVQLGGDGAMLRGLKLIGGPVKAGDSVQVDYSTDPPLVIAKGNAYLSSDDLEAALKKISGGLNTAKSRFEIMLFSGGGVVQVYSPTIEGLLSAVAAAGIGDLVVFPDIDISTNLTLPVGVSLAGLSSRQSIIRGKITLNVDCTLENMCVIMAETTANEVIAVDAQAAGLPSWIKNCEIHAYNCGTGLATAVQIQSNTTLLQITDSVVVADSKLGTNAHAFSGTGGICKVMNCKLYSKSADHFNGTTFYEYSDIGHVSEIDRACVPVLSELYEVLYSSEDPFADRSSAAWSPGVAHLVLTRSGSPNYWKYFCHTGMYIYFASSVFTAQGGVGVDQKVLQYRLADGNIDEKIIWTWANNASEIIGLIAYDEDKIYVLTHGQNTAGSRMIRVYFANFETGQQGLYYEFKAEYEGDPDTSLGETYFTASALVPVKNRAGDLIMVVAGYWRRQDSVWDQPTEDIVYASGPFFLKKNITLDEAWSIKIGVETIPTNISSHIYINDVQYAVAQSRYVGGVVNFDMNTSGHSAMMFWSFDTETDLIASRYIFTSNKHVDQQSYYNMPQSYELVGNNEDGRFYMIYYSDYEITGLPQEVVYCFNPVANTFTLHTRAAATRFFFMRSGKQGAFLVIGYITTYNPNFSNSNLTIKNLATLATILNEVSHPCPEGNFRMSLFINESNESIWYLKDQAKIRLWGLDDNLSYDIPVSGLAPSATTNVEHIQQLIGCYVVWGNTYVSVPTSTWTNKLWIIKST